MRRTIRRILSQRCTLAPCIGSGEVGHGGDLIIDVRRQKIAPPHWTPIHIYAAGRAHPYREPCIRVLAAVSDNPEAFVTDPEVLQEITHHYRRTERWEAGQVVVESFVAMMRGRVSPLPSMMSSRRDS